MWWKKTSRKALDLCCFGGTFSSHHKMSSKYLLPLSISEQTQEDLNPPALCSPPLRRTTHTACGRVEGRELQQRSPAKNKETNFIPIKFFSYHIMQLIDFIERYSRVWAWCCAALVAHGQSSRETKLQSVFIENSKIKMVISKNLIYWQPTHQSTC